MSRSNRNKSGRRRRAPRGQNVVLTAFCVALAAIMLGLAAYIGVWYLNRGRIRAESERYGQMYVRSEATASTPSDVPSADPSPAITVAPSDASSEKPTDLPTSAPSNAPSPALTDVPTSAPTDASSPIPTDTPSPVPSNAPIATLSDAPTSAPTDVPTSAPTDAPTSAPTDLPTPAQTDGMPVAKDIPLSAPDGDTLILALPTAPPIQQSFDALLAANPETVGFLEIEGMLSLPVAQRENDNEYYLSHSFEGAPAQEGALFLDGMNRLVPEDDCLIVYGHNMKNRTMFGRLTAYADVEYMRRHPLIRFDTLYENRSYAVFAAFSASMKPGDSRYFDVRRFIFDELEFDKFVLKLQSRSVYSVPIDVRYGDRLLLLVTCSYTNRDGRFILALRQLREGENEADVWAQTLQATAKP